MAHSLADWDLNVWVAGLAPAYRIDSWRPAERWD